MVGLRSRSVLSVVCRALPCYSKSGLELEPPASNSIVHPVHTEIGPDIEKAARLLEAGELVAIPTETVYGLGARADDDAAVARIFAAKGRPSDHPLIVHAAGVEDASRFGDLSSSAARRLSERLWPGPLTLIVPRHPDVATAAAAGQSSVGLRVPCHPVALALLQAASALGVRGVAGPSANRFGRVSPTCAAHVTAEFGDQLLVVDGGECEVGIESAIVDCTRPQPALLRPGQIERRSLEEILGQPLSGAAADAPRAPGTLPSHYAPSAKLRVMDAAALQSAFEVLRAAPSPAGLAVYSRTVRPGLRGIEFRPMPPRPDDVAHELFAVLRDFDARGMQLVWVEAVPPDPQWDGVRDRLTRASAA